MPANAPILYRDYNTFIHRLDARVKVYVLFTLIAFLFFAPSWQWMLVPLVFGLLIAAIAHTPWKWLVIVWMFHLPSFLTFLLLPAWTEPWLGDPSHLLAALSAELRQVLAWTAAILIIISLLSTIAPDQMERALRGVGLPAVVASSAGLTYRLLFTSLNEISRIADAMRLKGLELDWRRPTRFFADCWRLTLPVIFAVVRRAPMMMAAVEMRGVPKDTGLGKLKLSDVAVLGLALVILCLAILDRFSVLPFTSAPLGD